MDFAFYGLGVVFLLVLIVHAIARRREGRLRYVLTLLAGGIVGHAGAGVFVIGWSWLYGNHLGAVMHWGVAILVALLLTGLQILYDLSMLKLYGAAVGAVAGILIGVPDWFARDPLVVLVTTRGNAVEQMVVAQLWEFVSGLVTGVIAWIAELFIGRTSLAAGYRE